MAFHVGTSGWQYPHWAGVFYPAGLKSSNRLLYYSQHFRTLELNVTFYRQVKDSTFRQWHDTVPGDFLFSVKMSRFITHIRRLRVDDGPVGRFLEGVKVLGDKLGAVLIQLPPGLRYDRALLSEFLGRLDGTRRYTVEARNSTFVCDDFFALLKERGVAWCIADTAGRYPYHEEVTADFVYIRLHGSRSLYASDYRDDELRAWRDRITAWNADTFVYFDNDFNGYAVKNAMTLKSMLPG